MSKTDCRMKWPPWVCEATKVTKRLVKREGCLQIHYDCVSSEVIMSLINREGDKMRLCLQFFTFGLLIIFE